MKAVFIIALLLILVGACTACTSAPPAPPVKDKNTLHLTDEMRQKCDEEGGCALITRKRFEEMGEAACGADRT